MSDVIKGLGIEIDLSGDADSELRDWIKGMKEARGGADSFAGSMTDLEKEMVASAKKIGMSEEHLKDLINETRRAKEVQGFADKYGFAMNDIQKKTQETAGEMTKFGDVLNGVMAAGAMSKIFGAGKEMVGLAAEYEQTAVGFEVMLGNADKAKTVLADLDKFSNVTPFEPKQVNEAAKTMLQFKVQSEDLIPLMQKVGDVAAGTGKDYNSLAAMVGKANALNKVDNEMLQQVPVLYGELAKSMGKSEKQIFEMASAGKIGFKELEGAMASMTSEGGVFFGMMDKQSKTAIGLWSTLMGNVDNVKRSFGQMILEGLRPLLGYLVQFTGWLANSKTAMTVLKIAMLIIIPMIGVLLVGAIGKATIAMFIMAKGVLAATWPFMAIAALIVGLILIVEDLYMFFTGGESIIGEFAVKAWGHIKEFFLSIWAAVTGFISSAIDALIEFGKKVVGIIVWPYKKAYELIKDALGAVWDFLFGDEDKKEIRVSGSVKQLAGARAGGGPVDMGKTYLVGENGPELFTPDSDGHVLPEVPPTTGGKSASSSSGGGKNIVISPVLNFNGPVSREDGEYIKDIVARVMSEIADNIDGGVRAGLGLEVG